MSTPEQEPPVEAITTAEAVWELKSAQTVLLVSPMVWDGEDEQHRYLAVPFEVPGKEPVDLATLGDLPLWRFTEVLNMWELARIGQPDINGEVPLDQFLVAAGLPLLHTSHLIPAEAIAESEGGKVAEILHESASLQGKLGLDAAESKDYEVLASAITYLKVIADAARRANYERRLNMTEEERRWERMQKYQWLITPEMDRNGSPRWWGISEGSLLWAVHSATPDEAIIMIEDSRDGMPMLPFFFVDEYPEGIQTQLVEKLGDKKVVRLIPFSIEEWPEDPENMTKEQKAAFDRLKRD